MADMQEMVIEVPVTLHHAVDLHPDVSFVVTLCVPMDMDSATADWLIDDVLEDAKQEVKNLLRPYVNNNTHWTVDTPAIPRQANRWGRGG